MRIYDEAEIEAMINDCATREGKLNDWERKFIASVGEKIDSGIMLSDNQCEKLNEIWERIT